MNIGQLTAKQFAIQSFSLPINGLGFDYEIDFVIQIHKIPNFIYILKDKPKRAAGNMKNAQTYLSGSQGLE